MGISWQIESGALFFGAGWTWRSPGFRDGQRRHTPPVFYCYAVPRPEGFSSASAGVEGASWSDALGEFVLPYHVVRSPSDPERTLMEFLQQTYSAVAELGHWDRAYLERPS
jgi:hypothetical protein